MRGELMVFPVHQITVDVPDCPTVVPNVAGIPSWVVGWGLGISAVILLALIVSIAVVRCDTSTTRSARSSSVTALGGSSRGRKRPRTAPGAECATASRTS